MPAHTAWPAQKGRSAGSRDDLTVVPPPTDHCSFAASGESASGTLNRGGAHATEICQEGCMPAEVTCSVRIGIAADASCQLPHRHSSQAALAICHQPLPDLRWLSSLHFQVLLRLMAADLNWTPFVSGFLVLPLHTSQKKILHILGITALPRW